MPLRIGKYRVEWTYDPYSYITYCFIIDSEDNMLINVSSKRAEGADFDKVKARVATFKKALKGLVAKNIISKEEVEYLKKQFNNLPNKGVI